MLGAVEPGRPIRLTGATAAPPLAPSAPPSLDDVPNNHRFYAFQWFFFAAAGGADLPARACAGAAEIAAASLQALSPPHP